MSDQQDSKEPTCSGTPSTNSAPTGTSTILSKHVPALSTAAAIGYIRVSTGKQDCSMEVPEERIKQYCQLAGLQLVELLREPAVSAAKIKLDERPVGSQIAKWIAAGVRHVVALKLDRLSRNAVDALTHVEEWQLGPTQPRISTKCYSFRHRCSASPILPFVTKTLRPVVVILISILVLRWLTRTVWPSSFTSNTVSRGYCSGSGVVGRAANSNFPEERSCASSEQSGLSWRHPGGDHRLI